MRGRNREAERAAPKRLEAFGLQAMSASEVRGTDAGRITFALTDAQPDWPSFLYEVVPQLEREGWRVEVEDSFRHSVVDGGGEWSAELQEAGGWWFSLDLGIEVDGERVPLLPVLTSLLGRLRDMGQRGELDALAHNGVVFGKLPDGRHLALPLERTKAILTTLVELYDPATVTAGGKLGISAGELASLAAVETATQLRWLSGDRLRTRRAAGAVFGDRPSHAAGGAENRVAAVPARRARLAAISARL